ncbi:late competence development ComFB family protein [Alkalihalobacillus sp. AL-G]|uniref:late competence development ComFB family protein n=1 Tax=Alkalihalobacillus sp. AL-G TaxID=2926399 RepID=UPI00272CC096|nr:late competence development ComFB family protein [Alkalihalobacillus sp. AL-G]WLD94815.1 late competence development ComFB family protein [Alkalihalobacillus sp. AL-G]
MNVMNVMELLAMDCMERNWNNLPLKCKCEICMQDVYAITLNKLKPRYVSKEKGYAYVKAQHLDEQSKVNILNEMIKASNLVNHSPSHLEKPSTK